MSSHFRKRAAYSPLPHLNGFPRFVFFTAMSMQSVLKRTGKYSYCGMLVARGVARGAGCQAKTLFCRFVGESGCSIVFVLSENAHDQFMALEQWLIYTMTSTGKVMRKSECLIKFSIANTKGVHLKYKCQQLALSPSAWPLRIPYEFVSWDALHQLSGSTFFQPLWCGS